MSLLATPKKKQENASPKKTSFLKNISSLLILSRQMFKLPKGKKGDKNLSLQRGIDVLAQSSSEEELEYLIDTTIIKQDVMADDSVQRKGSEFNLVNGVYPCISGGEFGSGEDLVLVKVSADKSGDGFAYAKDKEISAIDDFRYAGYRIWKDYKLFQVC
ncbi:putative trans-resveratrol di-O-methyltransferase-like isoform 1 [Capsicum annuum]|nr:putative trans-resveratrol di-O-methyltransferase-like isoform 1 [Capsicum annuum]KAF3648135.1 putative trans-resveratrol di-O-methyltransferase-like isoform 1 [Capsicum annuum]